MLPLCGGDSFNTIRFRGSMDSTALAPSGPLWVRASGRRPRRFAEAPAGKRQCTSPTLCLVAGKAPWQTARCACRLARCACRSSSQKSRCAAIFGSPICSPLGVSADTRRKSAGISLVSYASVVQWIVQPSHLRGRCGFARAVADRDALPRLPQGNGNAQVRRSASSQARRLGRRRAALAALPVAPAAPLPKNLAALRFSGALFYLLRGFGGGPPSPISKKPPCMGGFFNIK